MNLKSCPFCGESKQRMVCFEDDQNVDQYMVECEKCTGSGPKSMMDQGAVQKWNTRNKTKLTVVK